jgi:hypothetical protein
MPETDEGDAEKIWQVCTIGIWRTLAHGSFSYDRAYWALYLHVSPL